MKILVVALNFAPEMVGCAKYTSELVDWVSKKSKQVIVITTNPFYPNWKCKSNYYNITKKENIVIEFDENLTTVATLKILNPTWLQLRDEENNIVLSKLMDKDEEFSYELKLNYNITAGNAGNILVLIDDEVRGKIGKYGDILDSFVLYKDFTN